MSHSKEFLVLTSAGGIQCSYLIPLLYENYSLRLVVHSQSSQARLQEQYPNAEVLQADISEPSQCNQVLQDATRVYHVGPSLHPHELEIGLFMVDAAVHEQNRTGNFKHFIFSSVLNTQLRKMFNHDRKRYVEEYLFESGLNYTVLNPGDFLNMAFPIKRLASMEKPECHVLMGMESKSAFLVLEDYAEACAKVIDEGEKHYQAQYQMCSMPPVAYGDVANHMSDVLSKALEQPVPVSQMALQDAIELLGTILFGDSWDGVPAMRDGVERLQLYYRRRGLQGNPNVMGWLLGRTPTGYREWIERQIREVKEGKGDWQGRRSAKVSE